MKKLFLSLLISIVLIAPASASMECKDGTILDLGDKNKATMIRFVTEWICKYDMKRDIVDVQREKPKLVK